MGFAKAAWLLPPAFALHVADEAPGFVAWAQRNASPRYTQRDFATINALGFVMTLGAVCAVSRTDSRALDFLFCSAVVSQQALFNPIFHLATTIAYRECSPGLVSSMALFPALWRRITRAAVREGRVSRRGVRAGILLGGAIHAAAVARQVYGVGSGSSSSSSRQTS
jgi:Protein of unknown function with HXXEE motif